jgi:hypothetical protein
MKGCPLFYDKKQEKEKNKEKRKEKELSALAVLLSQ